MSKRSIEPLNLHDALLLNALIAPYIEEPDEKEVTSAFVRKVLDRMLVHDPGVYVRCIELMTGVSEAHMAEMESVDVLHLFLDGLKANQILSLYRFGKGLSYAG